MKRLAFHFLLPSLIAPSILMVLVLLDIKSFIMPPQAVSFISCSLQTPVYYDNAWRDCFGEAVNADDALMENPSPNLNTKDEELPASSNNVDKSELEAVPGAYDWGASYYIFQLRYLIFKPSFDISSTNLFDLNKAASFQIVGFFFCLAVVMVALSKELGRIDPYVSTLLLLALFVLMNGRAAPAFLGYALIAWAILIRNKGFAFELLALFFVAAGLFLSVVSTGLYISSFTLYILGFLLSTGRLLTNFQPAELTLWQRILVNTSHLLIIVTGLVILVPLFIRLVVFYGTGTDLLVGVFSHGVGSFISRPFIFMSIAITSLTAAIVFAVFAWRTQSKFRQFLTNHNDLLTILFIALVPLPYVVFGYTAAVTSAVGFALLLGRLSFNIRSRYLEASLT